MSTLNIKGFPEELYKALVDMAKHEHRSLAQEVIFLLRKAVNEQGQQRPSILDLRGLGKKYRKKIKADKHIANERESWD